MHESKATVCIHMELKNILQTYLLNLNETTFVSLDLSAQEGLSLCEGQSTTME